MQRVVVCCSVFYKYLICLVCCSVLQRVAIYIQCAISAICIRTYMWMGHACCSVLQCVAVCFHIYMICSRELQCVAAYSHVYASGRTCGWFLRVAACCSVLQSVAVCSHIYMICCSVLQCSTMCSHVYTICIWTYMWMGHAHSIHRCLTYVHVRICIWGGYDE